MRPSLKVSSLLARAAALVLLGAVLATPARATLVDFEPGSGTVVLTDGAGGILQYVEDGVTVNAIDAPGQHFHIEPISSSNWLAIFSSDSHGAMFSLGGTLFDLLSLDTLVGGGVTGRLTSSTGAVVDVAGSFSTPFGSIDFAALPGWTDMSWFTWTFAGPLNGCDCPARLDNVKLSAGAVPEPGALALLGTAALTLTALRRRRGTA